MQFKDVLKALREERGISQKSIATACKLSPTCVCQLETGARNPTGSTLEALADFFEVSTDYLLGREDDFGIINLKSEPPALSTKAQELVDIFNALDSMHQIQVLEYARYFAERSGKKIKKF